MRFSILQDPAQVLYIVQVARPASGEFSPQATVSEFFPATAGAKLVSAGTHENLSEYGSRPESSAESRHHREAWVKRQAARPFHAAAQELRAGGPRSAGIIIMKGVLYPFCSFWFG
jgi:hypothetical protein